MQGNLNQVQLPEVLQFISMGKSTGLLTVREPRSGEITLVIHSGRIINSSALERRRRLGDLLVHRGIIKRSTLREILSLQKKVESDKRLGSILIERDIVPESTIRDVLRLQLEEEIWNLFGLDEGEFRFLHTPEEQIGEALVEIEIDPLLLEGTRRQDEWRKIAKVIPNDNVILAVRDLSGDPYLSDKRKVTALEWRVLAQVNGRFPIRAIVNRSGLGRFEVYRLVAEFLERNILYIKGEDSRDEKSDRPAATSSTSSTQVPTNSPPISGGVTSLLSRLTGGGKRDERAEKRSFASPIGYMAFFINRLVDQFFQLREIKGGTGDQRMMHALWTDQVVSYTKADLITVERNQLNADRLEEYLRLFEFGEATQDCYEDSLEALQNLLGALIKIFSSRVGEKTTNRVVREVLEEVKTIATHRYASREFKLEDTVQKILGSA